MSLSSVLPRNLSLEHHALERVEEDLDVFHLLHQRFWGNNLGSYCSAVGDVASAMDVDSEDEEEVKGPVGTPANAESFDKPLTFLDLGPPPPEISPSEKLQIPQLILVRSEYRRLYAFLEQYHVGEGRLQSAGVVVTGQPGIGKTVFLYYAAARLLSDRKPFILVQDQCYLYVEEGVYVYDPKLSYRWKQTLLVLIDSDTNQDGLPSWLRTPLRSYFPVFSTSPVRARWANLTSHAIVVMNPWDRAEIHTVASTSPDYDDKMVDYAIETYGPIPRLCIIFQSDGGLLLRSYGRELSIAIQTIEVNKLRALSNLIEDMSMDALSHKLKICLIRRAVPDIKEFVYTVSPITESVASRLALQLRHADMKELVRLYRTFQTLPSSRGMAGCLFEAFCHFRFQKAIDITYNQMMRLSMGSGATKKKPRWYSTHSPIPIPGLEQKWAVFYHEPGAQGQLFVTPTRVIEYDLTSLPDQPSPDAYYISKVTNEVAMDSFIVHNEVLYIFQFTIADKHSFKPGLNNLLKHLEKFASPVFIFVIPTDNETFCASTPYDVALGNLQPYVAQYHIDMEGLG